MDMHAHHHVVGVDKAEIKAQIRQLKRRRDELVGAGGATAELHVIRRQMHHLKRELHKATV
jgi:hypothetical protein